MENKNEICSKLLYCDINEDRNGNYLNINLLRSFKNFLVFNMTEKEKGCINLYQLENFLIERALDPSTEEIYKSKIDLIYIENEDLIEGTLRYLRSKVDYWIINTEVYLEILYKNKNSIYDDKLKNKDLEAIYNYIYSNSFSINPIQINNNKTDTSSDLEYFEFLEFMNKDSYLEFGQNNKLIFDISILPHFYNYLNEKNLKYFKDEISKIKIQNLMLFFSHIQYDPNFDYLWKTKLDNKNINSNGFKITLKKYSLRQIQLKEEEEEEIENKFIQNQIIIFNLIEMINKLKNTKIIKEFLDFLKNKNVNIYLNLR